MPRTSIAALTVLVFLSAPGGAAEPAGAWKFRFRDGTENVTLLLVFSESGGKWSGTLAGSSSQLVHTPQFTSVTVAGNSLRFALTFDGKDFIRFDGVMGKDGKKITGSYSQFGGPLQLTEMHPSKLNKLEDRFDAAREDLTQLEPGRDLFDAGFTVAMHAAERQVPVEEIRAMTDRLLKAAAGYGALWEQTVALQLADMLVGHKDYQPIALTLATKAEGLLILGSAASARLAAAETLARVMAAAGKPDDAKRFTAAAVKLEEEDYAAFLRSMLRFPIEKLPARKPENRAAVVEIFTGAECRPCVAVNLAAEAVMKAYLPSDAIVLEYHFHVPHPDALACPDGMDRVKFYKDQTTHAPVVLVNGRAGPEGGGPPNWPRTSSANSAPPSIP